MYEAHERVIALLEAGAPLCLGSQCLLKDMAEAMEEFKAQVRIVHRMVLKLSKY